MISKDAVQASVKQTTSELSRKFGTETKEKSEIGLSMGAGYHPPSPTLYSVATKKVDLYSRAYTGASSYHSNERDTSSADSGDQRQKDFWKPSVISFNGHSDSYTLNHRINRTDAEQILQQTGFEIPLPPGQEYLSNYVMGRGGFGEFCVGYAEKQQRFVGIKITQGSESVKREVALYQALSHKGLNHILPILDEHETFNAQGEVVLYQVMELAGLGSTDKLKNSLNLIRDTQFKEQVLFCLAEGLLQGLAEMHQSQFYHLDVKPNNLVVRQDGRVFLIDFGCSAQNAKVIMDMTGKIGDRRFFSPERQREEQFCDAAKIDAFAAGLTLLYLTESQFSSFELEQYSTALLLEVDHLFETTDKQVLSKAIQRIYEQQRAKVLLLQNPALNSFWSLLANLLELDPKKRPSPEAA